MFPAAQGKFVQERGETSFVICLRRLKRRENAARQRRIMSSALKPCHDLALPRRMVPRANDRLLCGGEASQHHLAVSPIHGWTAVTQTPIAA